MLTIYCIFVKEIQRRSIGVELFDGFKFKIPIYIIVTPNMCMCMNAITCKVLHAFSEQRISPEVLMLHLNGG